MAPTFVVRDVLEHRYAARAGAHVGDGGQRRAAERAQSPARQLVACQLAQFAFGSHERRGVGKTLRHVVDDGLHDGQPLLFHEQRQRLHPAGECALHHLVGLGDEDALLGFELAAQLHFGQPRIRVEPRVVQRLHPHDHCALTALAALCATASATSASTSCTSASPRSQNCAHVMTCAPMCAMSAMFAA